VRAGHGLALNGQPFINPGNSQPVYFGAPTAQQPAAPAPLKPARKVQVSSGSSFIINVNYGNCRVDDISDYVHCPTDSSNAAPVGEQFALFSTTMEPGVQLKVGEPALVQSIKTGAPPRGSLAHNSPPCLPCLRGTLPALAVVGCNARRRYVHARWGQPSRIEGSSARQKKGLWRAAQHARRCHPRRPVLPDGDVARRAHQDEVRCPGRTGDADEVHRCVPGCCRPSLPLCPPTLGLAWRCAPAAAPPLPVAQVGAATAIQCAPPAGDTFAVGDQGFTNPGNGPLFFSPKPSLMTLAPAPPPSSCTGGAGVAALGTSPGMSSAVLSPDTAYALTVNDQGVLSVAPNGGGKPVFSATAAMGCLGPYGLVMQGTGQLALRDRTNRTVWSSGSACSSSKAAACYRCAQRAWPGLAQRPCTRTPATLPSLTLPTPPPALLQLHGQHSGPAGGAGPELHRCVEQRARRQLQPQDPAHQRRPARAGLLLVRALAPAVPAGVTQRALHGRGEPVGGAAGAGQHQRGGGVEPAGRAARERAGHTLHP
jgi:hypothetical protein